MGGNNEIVNIYNYKLIDGYSSEVLLKKNNEIRITKRYVKPIIYYGYGISIFRVINFSNFL